MRVGSVRRRMSHGVTHTHQNMEGFGKRAEKDIDRYFFLRLDRFAPVRRFVFGWIGLLVILMGTVIAQSFLMNGLYQSLRPVPGGTFNEGVLGNFTTANPLYATSDVDKTVSHLIFSGLFTYSQNNKLIGDLASGYSVNAAGTTYTVQLKPHLTWQDGQPLTSQDVAFTYHLIQNQDAQSPLASSWQGIKVATPSATTITFTLPNVLASFPYTMTNGIVPQHILASVPAVDLRTADFNTVDPVGAGPFKWAGIQVSGNNPSNAEEQIVLQPFARYQGGKPKLNSFAVYAYAAKDQLLKSFRSGQLNGVEGLNRVPAQRPHASSVHVHSLLLTAGTYVFFKTSTGVLADQTVRRSLVQAANVPLIIRSLGYITRPVREPLLEGQLGYNPAYAQAGFNLKAAEASLSGAGWIAGKDGILRKNNQPLQFTLTVANTSEYLRVGHQLASQWRALGADVQVQALPADAFATALSSHGYDAVLYGISIGVDPDVFVYWDSSQADIRSANRLNFSEYKDPIVDEALESGRTRLSPALRSIKYQPFLQAWQQAAPALGLYQPRVLYITNGLVAGLSDHAINTASERLDNVQNWEVREAQVTN